MNRSAKVLLIIAILSAIVGAIGLPDAITLWKDGASDVQSLTPGSIEDGEMFDGKIDLAVDMIAKETSTKTYGFMPVSKTETPYYLVETENGYVVIDVTLANKQEDFEKLVKKTWELYDGKTKEKPEGIEVTLTAERIPVKVREYLQEYCEEGGMSAQDYSTIVETKYCLKTINYDYAKYTPPVCFGIALFCGLILLIKKLAGSKNTAL